MAHWASALQLVAQLPVEQLKLFGHEALPQQTPPTQLPLAHWAAVPAQLWPFATALTHWWLAVLQ